MKILYHHRVAARDGMDVHITEIIRAFRNAGHEVLVVGPDRGDEADFGRSGALVGRIRQILPRFASELLEVLYDRIAFRRLRQAYLDFQPDVLYERHNLFLTAGKRLHEIYGAPYLLEVNSPLAEERKSHGGLALEKFARRQEASVWRSATHVFPVTQVLAEVLKDAGVDANRISVLHNGVDLTKFNSDVSGQSVRKRYGLSEDDTVLGFTGFIRPWHGLDKIIREMGQNPDMGYTKLLIAGDGPARPDLEQLARDLDIQDRVHFAGLVGRDDIPGFVAAFDIALIPSATDYASPLKLFEYLALGIPTVAPAQANIEEVLTAGETGLLFRSSDEMVEAIKRLSQDQPLRQKCSEGSIKRLHSGNFIWAENASRILSRVPSDQALREGR